MTLWRALAALGLSVVLGGGAMAAPARPYPWAAVDAALKRQDHAEARRLAEAAAATGDPEAINGLSVLVGMGVGGPADPARARTLLEQAVAAGSLGGKLNLARALASDNDQSQWPRAMALLQDVLKDRRAGEGVYYPAGRIMMFSGGDQLKTGVEYMKKAVDIEPTNADAQYLVARSYQTGWGGTEKDARKAFAHFEAAAKLGNHQALRYVGMARLNGEGVAKDPARALQDFRKAAEQGDTWAMIDVAVMLAVGEGVAADPPQARDWYRRAADTGSAHALRGLGMMLFRGEGGPADPIVGRAYIEMAAAAGDANARTLMGQMLGPTPAADRARVEAAKADWLKTRPAPRAD